MSLEPECDALGMSLSMGIEPEPELEPKAAWLKAQEEAAQEEAARLKDREEAARQKAQEEAA